MSAPTEDRGQLWHPTLGDLQLWYELFEKYAASSPANSADFHAAHIAEPVGLDRVWQAIQWLEANHADTLKSNPLPSTDTLRSLLTGAENGARPSDDGSMCHAIWHWIHGEH